MPTKQDDSSWKVRRSALRGLHAVVASGLRGGGAAILPALGPLLVGCLREREEAVRLEAVAAVAGLLQASVAPQAGGWEPDTGAAAELFAPLGVQVQPARVAPSTAATWGAPDTFPAAFGELLDAAVLGFGASALVRKEAPLSDAAAGDVDMVGPATPRFPLPAAGQSLVALVPALLRASVSLLGGRRGATTVKTRVAVLGLLRTAGVALSLTGEPRVAGAAVLRPSLALLLRALVDAAKERGHSQATSLRHQAAMTLHATLLVFSASPADIAAHASLLVAPIAAEIRDDYYKIQSQGLLSAAALIALLRPAAGAGLGPVLVPPADFAGAVSTLLDAILPRFEVSDVDQEVKEAALTAVAALLAHAGDVPAVAAATSRLLRVFLSRLRSETTRTTALRALSYVAASPLRIDLSSELAPMLAELAVCLRQNARALRVQALHTLCALIASQQSACTPAALRPVLSEMADGPSAALSDGDLQLTRVALDTASELLGLRNEGLVAALASTILPRALSLASSPVMQGAAQASLQRFFLTAITAKLGGISPAFSFDAVLGGVLNSVAGRVGGALTVSAAAGSALQRSCQLAARCAAVICAAPVAPVESVRAATLAFLQEGTGAAPTRGPAFRALALYSLGEVGRHVDVPALLAAPVPPAAGAKRRKSAGAIAVPPVPAALIAVFTDPAEDLRSAAAIALGGVAAGSPKEALPAVLLALQDAAASASAHGGGGGVEHVYLLMTALREVLLRHTAADAALAQALLPALLSPAVVASPDEGIRGASAECLGRLVAADPHALLAVLPALSSSTSAAARFTAVAALRFAAGSVSGQSLLAAPFSPAAIGSGPLASWLPAPVIRDLIASSEAAVAGAGSGPLSVLAVLLARLADPDMGVRLTAATAVTAIAHAAPQALRPLLCPVRPDLFPLLKAAEDASAAAAPAAEDPAARPTAPGSVPSFAGYAQEGVVGVLLFHAMKHRDLIVEVRPAYLRRPSALSTQPPL